MSKGSKRRAGKPGAYEEGYDRIFGKPRQWQRMSEGGDLVELPPEEAKELDRLIRTIPTRGGPMTVQFPQ